MKTAKPVLGDQLVNLDDLLLAVARNRLMETAIAYQSVKGISISDGDLANCRFEHVLFENCRLTHCSFDKSSFTDVVFRGCDLSNSDFQDSYFNRCELLSVKAVGASFRHSSMMNASIEQGNFQYANFDSARLGKVCIAASDLSDAYFANCRLKHILLHTSQLVKTTFFQTPLCGIDFTANHLEGIIVSAGGKELQGAVVNLQQAADLAKLLGVVIK